MGHPLIHIPQMRVGKKLVREIWKGLRHRGRPDRKLPGIWLDEMTQKRFGCILVCSVCRFRDVWELRRRGYIWDSDYGHAAYCDRCKDWSDNIYAFYAEEKYKYIRLTNEEHNRRRREAIVGPEEMMKLGFPNRPRRRA